MIMSHFMSNRSRRFQAPDSISIIVENVNKYVDKKNKNNLSNLY